MEPFSPTPWERTGAIITDAHRLIVADCRHQWPQPFDSFDTNDCLPVETTLANAVLVSNAVELYRTLKELVEMEQSLPQHPARYGAIGLLYNRWFLKARLLLDRIEHWDTFTQLKV